MYIRGCWQNSHYNQLEIILNPILRNQLLVFGGESDRLAADYDRRPNVVAHQQAGTPLQLLLAGQIVVAIHPRAVMGHKGW